MLTYLTGSVRPDIAIATHQCARFSVESMRSHEQAVMRIGKYFLSTKEKGMIYHPDSDRGIEVFVDADFAGGWNPEDALNADNVYSRTGYVICYTGCPIFWQSKLQTEIALSTAEAEYIALSQALRETIPMTNLMREMNVIFPLYLPQPKFVLSRSRIWSRLFNILWQRWWCNLGYWYRYWLYTVTLCFGFLARATYPFSRMLHVSLGRRRAWI
jgi:hypothetical protein